MKIQNCPVYACRVSNNEKNQEKFGNAEWEKLGISNDFLFGKVIQDQELCKVENICKEDKEIPLNDEMKKIFLNIKGYQDDISKELKVFLDYVAGKTSQDYFIKKLMEAVEKAKKNRKWRHEYMTLLMRDKENFEKGKEQGIEQGIVVMIENALQTTGSIEQTSKLLKLDADKVKKIAIHSGISIVD